MPAEERNSGRIVNTIQVAWKLYLILDPKNFEGSASWRTMSNSREVPGTPKRDSNRGIEPESPKLCVCVCVIICMPLVIRTYACIY